MPLVTVDRNEDNRGEPFGVDNDRIRAVTMKFADQYLSLAVVSDQQRAHGQNYGCGLLLSVGTATES